MKTITVAGCVKDLCGLMSDLQQAEFVVLNVGSDYRQTYVFLDDSEEKDPTGIVEAKAVAALSEEECPASTPKKESTAPSTTDPAEEATSAPKAEDIVAKEAPTANKPSIMKRFLGWISG